VAAGPAHLDLVLLRGRQICEELLHVEVGDLRWVGAVLAKELDEIPPAARLEDRRAEGRVAVRIAPLASSAAIFAASPSRAA